MAVAELRRQDLRRGVVGPVAVEEVCVLVFYWTMSDTGRRCSFHFFNLDRDGVVLLVLDVLKGAVAPQIFLLAPCAIHFDLIVVTLYQVVPDV